jgi:hypothetical protein
MICKKIMPAKKIKIEFQHNPMIKEGIKKLKNDKTNS